MSRREAGGLDMGSMANVVIRPAGALLLVVGGVLVLDWAKVFGDGGSAMQLIGGIVAFLAGLALFIWGIAITEKS